MKINYKEVWCKFILIMRDKSGELIINAEKPPTYREVKIGKILYRLTILFEGEKDIDQTVERLAVRNAISQPNPQKQA